MQRKRMACAMAVATAVAVVFGSTAVSAASVLKRESQGSEVVTLQRDLIKLGYLSSDATGYYGELTEDAVKAVQKEYGYKADGIAGDVTQSLVDRLLGRDKTSSGSARVLKEGDENSSVTALQKNLIKLGYLDTKATGYYGPATREAVTRLQKKNGYKADGIAGSATLGLVNKLMSGTKAVAPAKEDSSKNAASTKITAAANSTAMPAAEENKADVSNEAETGTSVEAGAAASDDKQPGATDNSEPTAEKQEPSKPEGKAEDKKTADDFLLKWYGNVENKFDRGDTATVYDIKSGKSFKIKRTYGSNHADCETLTKADTAIMKEIYGGTWNWERRPVIIKVNGMEIAASMTGYPHAGMDKYAANKTISSRSGGYGRGTNLDSVKGNNMNGVFDIHFLGSKNHYNNRIDPKHQDVLKEAAKWAAKNLDRI